MRKLLTEHLGLAISFFFASVVAMGVLRAADGNVTTTLSIVQSADLSRVVLAIALRSLPTLVIIAAFAADRYLYWTSGANAGLWRSGLGVFAVGYALSGLLSYYWWIAIASVTLAWVTVWFVPWWRERYNKRFQAAHPVPDFASMADQPSKDKAAEEYLAVFEEHNRKGRRDSSQLLLVIVLQQLVVLFIYLPMWLPPVRVAVEGRNRPIVGYELSSNGGQVTLLTEDRPRVIRLDAATVESVTTCTLNDQSDQTVVLFRLFGAESPRYPPCEPRRGKKELNSSPRK